MATPIRKESNSGFYHVIQLGVNHYDIFEDDEDRSFFMEALESAARKYGATIHAWCLLSNHTHLLVKVGYEGLSSVMRQLGSVYAKYFNRRHGRSGPLFCGRFTSVCIETDAQFIAVVRYIHRNPIQHEKATLLGSYAWSSYKDYQNGEKGVCSTVLALDLFGGIANFVRIHEEEWPFERHLDIGATGRMSDDEARKLANVVLDNAGFGVRVSNIGTLAHELRNKAMLFVRKMVGCSLRQLQRLTAVPYSAIRRATRLVADGSEFLRKLPDEANPTLIFVRGKGMPLHLNGFESNLSSLLIAASEHGFT